MISNLQEYVKAIEESEINENYGVMGYETAETTPQGGTLRIGLMQIQPPSSLNPLLDFRATHESGGFNLFNCLVRWNASGLIIPDLAQSWETSEDGKNYTFYLYNNVTWHDGVSFNASDVLYTFNEILYDPDVDSYWRWSYYSCLNITSIDAPDPYTVVFHLQDPYAPFLNLISCTPILPEHIYEDNIYDERVIGTGPYKHVDWIPGTNWTIEANDLYFRGRPNLDNITFWFNIPIEQLDEALIENTIDLVPGSGMSLLDPSKLLLLEQNPGMTSILKDEFTLISMGVNLNNTILSDKTVRVAIQHSINQTAIIEGPYYGYARNSTGSIPPAAEYWYNPSVQKYEFNLTLAEELLDQAGYPRKPPEAGFRFNITLKVADNDPLRINATQMISDWLSEIGINVTLKILNFSDWYTDFYNRQFDLTVYGIRWVRGFDPDALYYLYHTDGPLNVWGYSNSTLDTYLEFGRNTTDIVHRKGNYSIAQEIIAEDLPNIFLYHPNSVTGYNNDFHDFTLSPVVKATDPYDLEKVWYEPTASGEANCPRIAFIDEKNRITGYYNGTEYYDIPNSTYTGIQSDPQIVKLRLPLGLYTIVLTGAKDEPYEIEVVSISLEYKYVLILRGYIREGEIMKYRILIRGDGVIVYPLSFGRHGIYAIPY
jgi:peptide/nickel transport system substrate-binding protein